MKKNTPDIKSLINHIELNNNKIPKNFALGKRFISYNFESKEQFLKVLKVLMWLRGIEFIIENKESQDRGIDQDEFRKKLVLRDKKCVVSEKHISLECQACHIIPFSEGGEFSESNGLLIANTFHKLFDDYIWSINPDNYCVEVLCDDIEKVGSIYEYKGKKINVKPTKAMEKNLEWHYTNFIINKNNFENNK